MFFKFGKGFAVLSFYLLLLPSLQAEESRLIERKSEADNLIDNPVTFSAQPAMCVSLHQGRTCYASVSLQWSIEQNSNICIVDKQQRKKLKCWKNSRYNQLMFEFESNKKIEFQLINADTEQVIAETVIEVSWVHKATLRKRRWRLF
jgi:hypothetical protein